MKIDIEALKHGTNLAASDSSARSIFRISVLNRSSSASTSLFSASRPSRQLDGLRNVALEIQPESAPLAQMFKFSAKVFRKLLVPAFDLPQKIGQP